MKKTELFLLFTFYFFVNVFAQKNSYNCYPTNWWTGMKWNHVQIMIHGNDIGNANAYTINYPGVKLEKAEKVENKNYVFLDIFISSSTKPGILKINVKKKGSTFIINFPIKKRRTGNGTAFAQGVTSKDLIYLIMPDRFSNGDTTNDRIPGMRDQSLDRDTVYARHGGDLKGIENHLDYLKSLGVTTLWLNPVIENDMPDRTEHGYAFTDHYKIDPRIGGEKAYQELIDAVHSKHMKMIQDAVYNHVGSYHFTVLDPPMKDWLHQWPTYTNTNYKDQVLFDPYASKKEKKIMSDGWFTRQMPDLNQENPYVANFLIQHALWTVEEFGIDGWRIDTYIYNNLDFMNRCNKALMDEYPKITMFGETWVHGVLNQSYFVQNNFNIPFKSNLQAPADFQTLWAITDAMTKDFGWTDGVNELYTTLAQDFVYKDPMRNVIFLDNHDLSRFYSVVDTSMLKYKAALAWLLTCRGIPELYYGDEIGMQGFTFPNDGHVRLDFPGGWPGDPVNKFTAAGRTPREDSIWNYIEKLANFRKNSAAIITGKMMQFEPKEDGLYVFFRYDSKQTIMTILNTSKKKSEVHINYYSERTSGFSKMKNIETGEVSPLSDFTLMPMQSGVWELEK
ncbi:MAG: cyclomaltodextrinase N-terminal domain-containing protein [Bacteroidota bacterium]|nr:cyclomaltodextrinase N-terminal domain-containing protein [Bacteroidota bacterium]